MTMLCLILLYYLCHCFLSCLSLIYCTGVIHLVWFRQLLIKYVGLSASKEHDHSPHACNRIKGHCHTHHTHLIIWLSAFLNQSQFLDLETQNKCVSLSNNFCVNSIIKVLGAYIFSLILSHISFNNFCWNIRKTFCFK